MLSLLLGLLSLLYWHKSLFNWTCSLHSANFAIGLIATVFRPREAVLSVGLYLLLGAIGLPVFAGGGAGLQALVGPTAGYLWFYLVYSGLTSSLTDSKSGVVKIFLANLLGDALVFVGGILSLHFLAGMPLKSSCCRSFSLYHSRPW